MRSSRFQKKRNELQKNKNKPSKEGFFVPEFSTNSSAIPGRGWSGRACSLLIICFAHASQISCLKQSPYVPAVDPFRQTTPSSNQEYCFAYTWLFDCYKTSQRSNQSPSYLGRSILPTHIASIALA